MLTMVVFLSLSHERSAPQCHLSQRILPWTTTPLIGAPLSPGVAHRPRCDPARASPPPPSLSHSSLHLDAIVVLQNHHDRPANLLAQNHFADIDDIVTLTAGAGLALGAWTSPST